MSIWKLFKEQHIPFQENAALSEYTTFRLGGKCPCVVTCENSQQLERSIKHLRESGIDFILIGGGSNLIVSDQGLPCVVIRYFTEQPLICQEGNELSVSASTKLDDLVLYAVDQGLEGLTFASGIPGTVGGAIVGNAGAFGKQVGDCLKSVTLLSPTGEQSEHVAKDLQLSYRDSRLKRTNEIVLSARFTFAVADKESLVAERFGIFNLRKEKHPDWRTHPCAGSIFRNIEPSSSAERRQAAGWFLEQAGVKQLRQGGASIFEKHANIIINDKNCTAQDVFDLSCQMAQAVKKAFGFDLKREVLFAGKFDSMPESPVPLIW